MVRLLERRGSRRRRWLVLVVLLVVAAWAARSRRAGTGAARAPVRRVPSPYGGRAVAQRVAESAVLAVAPTEPLPVIPAAPQIEGATRAATPVAVAVRPSPRPRAGGPAALPRGAAASLPDGSSPGREYTIKGNRASLLFHLPTSPYFARTKAELWFRTADDARAAGFTEWTPRRRAAG